MIDRISAAIPLYLFAMYDHPTSGYVIKKKDVQSGEC